METVTLTAILHKKRLFLSICPLAVAFIMLVLYTEHLVDAAPLYEPFTQPFLPIIRNVRLVGHLGTSPRAVAVQGTQAYVGMGREFAVLDVSDVAHPRRTGYVMLPEAVLAIDVAGSYAYVANSDGGLRVISVQDPARPVEIGVYPAYNVRGVAVSHDYAYLACWWSNDLRVVDVSNPAAPTEVGTYDLPFGEGHDVSVSENYVYLAAGVGGLRVIDVSDPYAPQEVGAYEAVEEGATSVDVNGDYVYVTDGASLDIVNVSNPLLPTRAGGWLTSGVAQDVTAADGLALLTDHSYPGLQILDVSLPATPTLVGTYRIGVPFDVIISDTIVYVAGEEGLHIVDVSHPDVPVRAGIYSTLSLPLDVAAAGTSLYVADAKRGVQIIDASDPAMPVRTGFVSAGISDVATADGYVYGVGSSLWVIDASNAFSPTVAGEIDIGGNDVFVADEYAYVASWGGGLHIVDISQPATPTEVSSCAGVYASRVAVAGNLAFVTAGGEGIHVIDVSDPLTPTLVRTYHAPGSAYHPQAVGHLLYVTWIDWQGGQRGMTIFDASDPESMIALDSAFFSLEPEGLAVQGTLAYVTTGGSLPAGVQVFDVSDPHDIVQVGAYDVLYGAGGVASIGDHVAVAGQGGGLYILRFQAHPVFLPYVTRQRVSN